MKLTITKGHVIAALIALVIGVGGGYFIGYEVEREHVANGIRHAFTQAGKEVVKETSGTGKESAWTQAGVKELQSKIEKESKTPPVTSTQAACSANQLAVKYTPTELEHSAPPTSVTDAIKVICHIAVAPTTTQSAPSATEPTYLGNTCSGTDGITEPEPKDFSVSCDGTGPRFTNVTWHNWGSPEAYFDDTTHVVTEADSEKPTSCNCTREAPISELPAEVHVSEIGPCEGRTRVYNKIVVEYQTEGKTEKEERHGCEEPSDPSTSSTSSSTEALATCEDGIAARDQICERSARIAEAKGIPLCPKGEQEEVAEEAHRNCEPQPSG